MVRRGSPQLGLKQELVKNSSNQPTENTGFQGILNG